MKVMKMMKKAAALFLTVGMVVSLAACGGSNSTSSQPAENKEETTETGSTAGAAESAAGIDKIVFGTNAEFPPFEFISSTGGAIGEFDGIDMAIAKQIGDDLGAEVSINNIEFDSLLIALQNGQIDAIIAGMTITEERKESVDFTTPYYNATQVMIVPQNSEIKTAADMADKKIVVIQGYTGESCVKDMGYPYEAFKKGSEAILELLNGKCDVVVIDSATAAKYVADNEELTIVEDEEAFGAEEYAIAVKKGNEDLLEKINTAIEAMLEDGTISEIAAQYSEN